MGAFLWRLNNAYPSTLLSFIFFYYFSFLGLYSSEFCRLRCWCVGAASEFTTRFSVDCGAHGNWQVIVIGVHDNEVKSDLRPRPTVQLGANLYYQILVSINRERIKRLSLCSFFICNASQMIIKMDRESIVLGKQGEDSRAHFPTLVTRCTLSSIHLSMF